VSLTAEFFPEHSNVVIPGSKPLCQLAPPSVEIAYPISAAPPSEIRPTWNAAMMVEPNT
jgi:hypothetical protein